MGISKVGSSRKPCCCRTPGEETSFLHKRAAKFKRRILARSKNKGSQEADQAGSSSQRGCSWLCRRHGCSERCRSSSLLCLPDGKCPQKVIHLSEAVEQGLLSDSRTTTLRTQVASPWRLHWRDVGNKPPALLASVFPLLALQFMMITMESGQILCRQSKKASSCCCQKSQALQEKLRNSAYTFDLLS